MSTPSDSADVERSPDAREPGAPVHRVTGRARARWLIPGGLLAAILIVMFVATMSIDTPVASVGIVITAIWFTAMVVTGLATSAARAHSRLQFGIMLSMALVGAALLYVIFLGAGG
jgi:hypothetical protein